MPFAICFRTYRIWIDHFNLSCIITPNNLVSVTSAIRVPFITMSSIHRGEFLDVKNMKLVLSIFSGNIFAFTQTYIFAISSFIWWLRSSRSLPVQNRFVAFAKSIGMKSSDTLGRSFMYTRKSRGPRMKPCETPHLSNLYSDSYPLKILDRLKLCR